MSQLVGSPCAKCQKTIPSIIAGEFCPECGNPVHKACKSAPAENAGKCYLCGCDVKSPSSQSQLVESAVPQSAQTPLRINKLSMRLMLGGSACVLIGIWWFFDGITGGFMEEIIGGLVWKGALLTVMGAGAAYYGYRIMTDPGPTDLNKPDSGKDQ